MASLKSGRQANQANRASRIVSLLPSATEIVACLGLGERLVGRSHECDFPAGVAELPVCTAARFSTDATSAAIDRSVKELLAQALSIYSIDEVVLSSLEPDLIVTQSQCEVCAVSLADVELATQRALGSSVRIVSLAAEDLEGTFADIETVAHAAGVGEVGGSVVAGLRARVSEIERRVAQRTTERPSTLCIEWLDPLMSAGNWMPEIVDAAGGRALLAHAGVTSPWIEWAQVTSDEPDVIVVLPCGFGIARAREEIGLLTSRPGWSDLAAVRAGRVFLTDGNQYFNRPGPRIVDSIEIMAELLHPSEFDFGHEGRGWEAL